MVERPRQATRSLSPRGDVHTERWRFPALSRERSPLDESTSQEGVIPNQDHRETVEPTAQDGKGNVYAASLRREVAGHLVMSTCMLQCNASCSM